MSKKTLPKKKGSQPDYSKQMDSLLKENTRLRGDLERAKTSDSFVGIESLTQDRVWLPSPESRSGRPEDVNKGYLLKKYGEIVPVPAYWIVDMISNKNPALLHGDIRINNELARQINPSLNFIDVEMPDEFKGGLITKKEIAEILKKGDQAFYTFIKKFEKDPFVLSRISAFVLEEREKLDEKDPVYRGYSSIIQYLDDKAAPNIRNEDTEEELP